MNFFIQMRESVIDFSFYKSIKNNRFSRSFLYLLLLFLIVYSINGTKLFVVTRIGIDEITSAMSTNVPDFKLENGEFSFSGDMPYYISNSADGAFVIDTTGQVDESILRDASGGMLITKDTVYVKNSEIETRRFSLTELKGMTLTKADILEFMPKLSWIMLIFIAFGFIFVFGWKLLNAVILALLGLILNGIMKGNLKYGNLLNISIYALTLPLLLQLALNLSGYPFPSFWLIYWGISLLYVGMAIRGSREENNGPQDVEIPEQGSDI